jgi:murein DD-endopeptidase MepM/ murein hydrolase activator NlpD
MGKFCQNEHSTIIITGSSQETKIFKIKQKYIENFRLYKNLFAGAGIFLFFLIGGLAYYIGYGNNQNQLKQLTGQIAHLKNRLYDKSEKNKMKEMLDNLNEAEASLDKIEKYLRDREVKSFAIGKKESDNGVGGEYYPADELNVDLIREKKEKINDLLEKIQSVPMGLPYDGRLTSDFGVRGNPISGEGSEFHPGLDLAGNQGDPIHTTANGTVSYANIRGGYGNCVVIKHGYGYETLYGHMSRINVKVEQKVKAGDVIGFVGSTGRSTAPHVHYEVIHNQEKENPKKFLKFN